MQSNQIKHSFISEKILQLPLLEKSISDKNDYDLFILENGLTCLLINDKNQNNSENSICSVSIVVNAGSFNDPVNRPGLAHFLEHMIFMGSDEFPDENAFSSFISSNGGMSNAYT